MASARCSESLHVNDSHAMFKGCENVPNVCVQMTPK